MNSRLSRSSYIIGGGSHADNSSRYKSTSSSISAIGDKISSSALGNKTNYDVRKDPAISSILAEVNGTDYNSPLLLSSNTLSGKSKFTVDSILSPNDGTTSLPMTIGSYGTSGIMSTGDRQSRHKSLSATYRENVSSRQRSISPNINSFAQLRSQRTAAAVKAADEIAAKALRSSKPHPFTSDINNLDRPLSSASLLMRPNSASSLPNSSAILTKQVVPIINTPTGPHIPVLSSSLHNTSTLSTSNHNMLSKSTSKLNNYDNDDDLVERLRERLMQRDRLVTLENKLLGSSSTTNSLPGGNLFNSVGVSSLAEKDYNILNSSMSMTSGPLSISSDLKNNTATSATSIYSLAQNKILHSPTKNVHSGSRLLLSSLSNADKRSIATGTDTPTYHKTYGKFGRTTPPSPNRNPYNSSIEATNRNPYSASIEAINSREEVSLRHSPVKSKNELMAEASDGKIHYCEVHGTLVRSSSSTDLRESGSDVSTFLKSRARHQTLAYGVSASDLGIAKCISSKDSWTNYRGFSSDMSTKIIRDEVGCGKMIYLEAELQSHISDYMIYR